VGGGLAAAALAAAIIGVALSRGGATVAPPAANGDPAAGAKAGRASDVDDAPIVVIDRDGEISPATDLLKAMQAALGSGGVVELRNREPLALQAGDKAITIATSKRTLHLRAAAGAAPVLKIDMKGGRPFLTTGSDLSLVVEGLTFEAFDSAPSPGSPAPPIVHAMGRARFQRCAMRKSGAGEGRAIVSVGGPLVVDGCWFEGFGTAIEVQAIAGRPNTVRQTMIVPGRPAADGAGAPAGGAPAAAVRTGRGVRVEFLAGAAKNAGREVKVEHCTFAGAGFLDLAGFSEASPITLVVNDCAVKADALIAWESKGAAPLDAKAVHWSGEGNQLDISGASWIVPPAGSAAGAVADLDAWMKLATERDPVRVAILFPLEPKSGAKWAAPQEYAVKPTGSRRPGADPERVGPQP
jgi:hypothetical protein